MTTSYAFHTSPRLRIGAWAKRKSIGVVSPSYGAEKISYGVSIPGYSYHKVPRIPLQRLERRGTFFAFTPIVMDRGVELMHTLNELPVGSRPFVVSFENELPRYLGGPKPWQLEYGRELMAGKRCRSIMGFSEIAAAGLRSQLVEAGYASAAEKVIVFRGTVGVPVDQDAKPRTGGKQSPLKILFVGRDAFGKGLVPTLDALDDCRKLGIDIAATIVCNFEAREYISNSVHIDSQKLAMRMQEMPGVTHHRTLPNREIHQLMLSHDVLVFPTLDESLGWVAVEAGLAGMPVIATDIYAIPEVVVDGKTGILIPINKAKEQRWAGLWLEGKAFDDEVVDTFAALRQGIGTALQRFAGVPELVDEMGAAAREHCQLLYGIGVAQRQLSAIYEKSL